MAWLRARRGSRLAAITSGGAIPENALYHRGRQPEGITVGTVDEDFAVESLAGDIILLGNTSWRSAAWSNPDACSWKMLTARRPAFLSGLAKRRRAPRNSPRRSPRCGRRSAKSHCRACAPAAAGDQACELCAESQPTAVDWLKEECGLDDAGAEQAVEYIVAGRAVLGAVPTQRPIIAERFFDEGGGMQLVIHAPFGGRINKAWGLALRKRFCRSFNFELQAAATDNGINISLAEQHSFPLADVFHFLHPDSVRECSSRRCWFAAFRHALALGRRPRAGAAAFPGGKKVPPQIQRMRADDLLASVFPEAPACQENIEGDMNSDHPLVREAMKDVLTEAMDLDGLKRVLAALRRDASVLAVDTPVPSAVLARDSNANPYAYLDDAPLEERRARAVEMRRVLPEACSGNRAARSRGHRRGARRCVARRARRRRTARRAADAGRASLTAGARLGGRRRCCDAARCDCRLAAAYFEKRAARAVAAHVEDGEYWVAAERRKTFARFSRCRELRA